MHLWVPLLDKVGNLPLFRRYAGFQNGAARGDLKLPPRLLFRRHRPGYERQLCADMPGRPPLEDADVQVGVCDDQIEKSAGLAEFRDGALPLVPQQGAVKFDAQTTVLRLPRDARCGERGFYSVMPDSQVLKEHTRGRRPDFQCLTAPMVQDGVE